MREDIEMIRRKRLVALRKGVVKVKTAMKQLQIAAEFIQRAKADFAEADRHDFPLDLIARSLTTISQTIDEAVRNMPEVFKDNGL